MAWSKCSYVVILASAIFLAPASLYADNDDDDDDRKRSRHYRKKIDREADYTLYCHCPTPSSAAIEPAPTPVPPPSRKPVVRSPDNFPKETPTERASAKERQVELLEKELAEEHQLLSKATEAQAHEDIELHRKNIAAIRRELGNLYR